MNNLNKWKAYTFKDIEHPLKSFIPEDLHEKILFFSVPDPKENEIVFVPYDVDKRSMTLNSKKHIIGINDLLYKDRVRSIRIVGPVRKDCVYDSENYTDDLIYYWSFHTPTGNASDYGYQDTQKDALYRALYLALNDGRFLSSDELFERLKKNLKEVEDRCIIESLK